MTWVVGQTAFETTNDPVTSGLTFTRDRSYIGNAATTWNPTIAELGSSGLYGATYVPSVAGKHKWYGTGSDGQTTIVIEYDVVIPAADPAAIADAIAAVQADVTTVKAMTDVATSTRASAVVWTSGRAERLDRIGADSVEVRSATAASELIKLRQGADYTVSADTALEWDVTTTTDLSPVGTVVTLTISSRSLQGDEAISVNCAVTNPTAATKTITAELTDTDTGRLRTSEFTRYQIDAQIGADTVPLVEGRVKVLPALA